ncbi:DNA topoisomerase [Mucispirillum schaedleri]|jgi:DNA topoisomerase-3|uniref:DNA topoisomerase n=1 Tax=Mucispirillum schaedleri ASF457 TaxID=1379858 RepID=V2RK58_9BACT|nr:DNA topoisomerase [Mucispirillum schaedleri]MCX4360961.1 DNA topoisomerase [Mucispirillum schaedleri]USF24550.1 DNA topoisomerase 3 [Mucispirillum schaedleri ASF457]SIW07307.1 conserved hypothetical protein [Mucispirillum schaedleri ASF457]
MKLIIAEKPALAEAIKEAIGTDFQKKDSYYENKEYYISWCIGHLLEVMLPDENSKWSFDNLPLKHKGWNFQIKENTKKQYNIVKTLIDMSDTIIHAGDPDEEGQLIVDSILYKENIIDLKGNSKKTIKRLLVNDFNTKSIKKELSNLKDNNEYLNLSYMALARTLADKTFGYNLTRGYTLKNQEAGNNNVISIGRVQTPMLALIVRREQEIKNHVKSYYYTIKGSTAIAGSSLDFIYQTKAEEIDETKKITSEETANTIINRLNDNKSKAVVFKYETKEEIDTVPLPYNLLDLQVDCSKLYNMKADKVMSVTQDLREKHKAITYNRSDCNYLLDETYEQSPAIIACLQDINDEKLQNIVNNANIDIKSKAFNSSKTTAHTAIIPTETKLDFSAFSDDEKKVFLLIANRFVMQFLPPAKYLKHTITIKINDDYLINNHRQLLDAGWKGILSEKEEDETVSGNFDYSKIYEEKPVEKIDFISLKEETKPKKLYTTDSFLNDLKRVAVYCKNEKTKQFLKEKDKDKAGESGGIGTPATRSAIIKTLYDRGYIKDDKKNIVSTDLGKELISLLSDEITYPDMTALWHEDIKEINTNMSKLDDFINSITEFSSKEIDKITSSEAVFKSNAQKCPNCDTGYLVKRKGKDKSSYFWGCSTYPECKVSYQDNNGEPDVYLSVSCPVCEKGELLKFRGKYGAYWKCKNPECSKTFNDDKGKPDLTIREKAVPSEQYRCLECNSKLVRRNGKNGWFWGCSAYPKCKTIYQDNNGEPIYNKELAKKD